jgi:hypothetical protein
MRALIHQADPDVEETVKWAKPSNPAGVPIWEHAGILCTGEVYKAYVKLTFAQGAALADPTGLFNASLDGGTRRAIDLREGDESMRRPSWRWSRRRWPSIWQRKRLARPERRKAQFRQVEA